MLKENYEFILSEPPEEKWQLIYMLLSPSYSFDDSNIQHIFERCCSPYSPTEIIYSKHDRFIAVFDTKEDAINAEKEVSSIWQGATYVELYKED